ncbi:hypothetical protein [Ralstonia sp. RRA.1]|uniref:hypothetical protein n=1 Tax=Ralstonia sp. RRA TaxID=3122075 RepID=UPI0030D4AE7A
MSKLATKSTKEKEDYIRKIDGLSTFARVSPLTMIDSAIGPRQLKVFLILALHAKTSGYVRLSQERIAEMCGFFSKGKPDNVLVSRLISNANHAKQKSGTGPGLVELGYVLKHGQIGHDQVQEYTLLTPRVEGTNVVRPDGTHSPLNFPTNRQDPDYHVQRDKKAGQKAMDENKDMWANETDVYTRQDCLDEVADFEKTGTVTIPAEAYKKFGIALPVKSIPVVPDTPASPKFDPSPAPSSADIEEPDYQQYTKEEVAAAIADYHDGLEMDIPTVVIRRFGFKWPVRRIGSEA